MAEGKNLIACCGIDCSVCDIKRAPDDPELAMSIAKWIREEFDTPECKPETINCTWCRGEKEGHWSPDCWILNCCVEDNGFERLKGM